MRMVRSQRPIGPVEPEVHMLLRAAGQCVTAWRNATNAVLCRRRHRRAGTIDARRQRQSLETADVVGLSRLCSLGILRGIVQNHSSCQASRAHHGASTLADD